MKTQIWSNLTKTAMSRARAERYARVAQGWSLARFTNLKNGESRFTDIKNAFSRIKKIRK